MNEMEKDTTLMMMDESVWHRFSRVIKGIKAPKDTGEYRFARFEITRFLSSWGIALGVSLLVALLLVTFAVGQAMTKDSAVEVVMMTPETVKLDEIKEEIQKIQEDVDVTSDVAIDAPVISDTPVDTPSPRADVTPVTTPIMTKSPLIIKGLAGSMANRTAGGRSGAIRAYGGSGAGEEAVLRALRWLKEHQDEDGSWRKADPTDANAMAGLALLCFLAHGETPGSVEFGATVEKAMKYIVSKQNSAGLFGREYTHGICTYALSEGFALTKIMAIKDAMDKGIDVIIKGQQPTGGYDYAYKKGDRWDLSVAGWQFQALKAARMAGCSNPDLEKAIENGIQFLRKEAFDAKGGGFGYSGTPGQPGASSRISMTGAGVLCLQLLGKGDVPEVKSGLAYLKAQPGLQAIAWKLPEAAAVEKPGPNAGPNQTYAWYYITQAKFQKGGKDWSDWNHDFSPMLIKAQMKDGHWEGGDHGGKVYTTTLCCLMLEVYYRYLPTYKQVVAVNEAKPTAMEADDVVVDVR